MKRIPRRLLSEEFKREAISWSPSNIITLLLQADN